MAGAIGFMSAILGVGSGAGIVLAGPILVHLNYHWLFWIPLVMSAAATVATFFFVPESPVRAPAGINWLGAVLMSGWLTTGLIAVSYGPNWGWLSTTMVELYVATVVLAVLWVLSEQRSKSPLVDIRVMRIRAVWATNLAALLYGFGLFAMFITVPQFVQTPTSVGYGFGASVTQSGLYLLPFALAMVVVAPFTGWLALRMGSKVVLIIGSLISAACYLVLVVAHDQSWAIYVAAGLLGVGLAPAFASLANLIIENVPVDQTGVATGMNTNVRTIGQALGAGVATSLVVSQLLSNGYPKESGYVLAFAVSGIGLVVAALAACLIPTRGTEAVVRGESPSRTHRGGRGHRGRHRLRARGAGVTRAGATAGRRPLRRDAEVNLARILDAARLVFAEQGYGASMETIAERADVGVGTLYRRFPHKSALFEAVVDEAKRRNREIAEAVLDEVPDGEAVFEFVRRCVAAPELLAGHH